jgi:hypothetical protein
MTNLGMPGDKGDIGEKGVVGEETYGKFDHKLPLS